MGDKPDLKSYESVDTLVCAECEQSNEFKIYRSTGKPYRWAVKCIKCGFICEFKWEESAFRPIDELTRQ
jgi:transcription elongation factor Elf1